ncbi:MAG TPA: glutathione S-transferase family protein [Alphaproteobacteria bacterium]
MAAAKKGKRRTARKARRAAARSRQAAKRMVSRSARRAAKKEPGRARARAGARLTLYGNWLSMPSSKVGLMLNMLGVPFEYRHVDVAAGQNRTPEFLAMNRFGQVPVLRHGNLTVVQSNAILQYLADAFGRFGGRNRAERTRIAEWLFWEHDQLATGVGMSRLFARFMPQPEDVTTFMRRRGEQALDTLDAWLGDHSFLAGDRPTIADIAVFPWTTTADEGGFDLSRWPNVQAWAARMRAVKGVASPYDFMPKEDRPAAA